MKPFKIVKLIFQIASAALFLASILICALDMTASNTAFLAFMTAYGSVIALATVGIFLITSAQDTARRIGHGMVISSYAIGLTAALTFIEYYDSDGFSETSTAAIMMLVAVIMLALYYLCMLVLKIMQKSYPQSDSPAEDPRIVHIKEWKQIMEEGIISAEEYEEKRCKILGIEPKKKTEESK